MSLFSSPTVSENKRLTVVKLLQIIGLLGGVYFGATGYCAAQTDPLQMPFPLQASEADVRQVVSEIARRSGVGILVSDDVRGDVTIRSTDGSAADVLTEATSQVQAIWWYDGSIVHVESASRLTTVIISPNGLTLQAVQSELEALDLYDPRFPIRTSSDGSIFRVSGPEGYVSQVVALIETLAEVRRLQASGDEEFGLYLPRVYHGIALN